MQFSKKKTSVDTTTLDLKKDEKSTEKKVKNINYISMNRMSLGLLGILSIILIGLVGMNILEYTKRNDQNDKLLLLASYFNAQKDQSGISGKDEVQKLGQKYDSKNPIVDTSTTSDLYNVMAKMIQTQQDSKQRLDSLQLPYNNFLKNIYFPALNIWKDPYTDQINLLLGYQFLKNNSLIDTNLFNYWSNYFRNPGDNFEQNTIKNISITPIVQNDSGFSYQVTVKLQGTRKSFLALMDKLSTTSSPSSINLIDEFVFKLWDEVKKNPLLKDETNKDLTIGEILYKSIKLQQDIIALRMQDNNLYLDINSQLNKYTFQLNQNILKDLEGKISKNLSYVSFSQSDFIGTKGLFSSVQDMNNTTLDKTGTISQKQFSNVIDQVFPQGQEVLFSYNGNNYSILRKENSIIIGPTFKEKFFMLVNDSLINNTIKNVAGCSDLNDSCFYTFREKYRSIPSLAYTIGENSSNLEPDFKAQSLFKFLTNLSPILNINSFDFTQTDNTQDPTNTNQDYSTSISFTTYGEKFSDKDLTDISKYLGEKCLNSNGPLSLGRALELIDASITQGASDNSKMDVMKNYVDLKSVLQKSLQDYTAASNYNKSIKLVEAYRMLNDAGLCTK